eukprot:3273954-Rhodomonas_salina.1
MYPLPSRAQTCPKHGLGARVEGLKRELWPRVWLGPRLHATSSARHRLTVAESPARSRFQVGAFNVSIIGRVSQATQSSRASSGSARSRELAAVSDGSRRRGLAALGANRLQLLHHIHALRDLAEHDMLAVQPARQTKPQGPVRSQGRWTEKAGNGRARYHSVLTVQRKNCE